MTRNKPSRSSELNFTDGLLQKKDGRWSEVLVDIDPGSVSDEQTTSLRYVLSPGETVGSKVLLSDAVC